MDTVYKEKIPTCNLCEKDAKYDSNTVMGSHAFLCEDHYEKIGTSPSTKLENTPDEDVDEPDEIETVKVPMTMDSVAEVSCPYCGHPKRVEPDANYTTTCESCGNDYKVKSFI